MPETNMTPYVNYTGIFKKTGIVRVIVWKGTEKVDFQAGKGRFY